MQTQLPLALGIQKAASLDNFCWQGNQVLFDNLTAIINGHARQMHLVGDRFSGKTHLLQAICREFSDTRNVYYGSIKQLITLSPAILESFEHYDVIAIDDIDLLQPSTQWQQAIFHLFNQTYLKPNKVWISASSSSDNQNITGLNDLNSRLKLGLSLSINMELSPPETLQAIDWHIDFRQLALNKTQKKLLQELLPRKANIIAYIFENIEQQSLDINQQQIESLIQRL